MIVVTLIICTLMNLAFESTDPSQKEKMATSNGMIMTWNIHGDQADITLHSPRQGWVAVGFNTKRALAGSMLIMCRVVDGKAEVVEHYVLAPGDYRPVNELGSSPIVSGISGMENEDGTTISFTVPLGFSGPHHVQLLAGQQYALHMAYSMEDDFQHHSISRTLEQITL